MHRISNQNKNRNGDFKMNKAVIYFGATGNEAADQMVMQVLEEYCTVNGYEVVAVISENANAHAAIAFYGIGLLSSRG